jgi:hypothetical protein
VFQARDLGKKLAFATTSESLTCVSVPQRGLRFAEPSFKGAANDEMWSALIGIRLCTDRPGCITTAPRQPLIDELFSLLLLGLLRVFHPFEPEVVSLFNGESHLIDASLMWTPQGSGLIALRSAFVWKPGYQSFQQEVHPHAVQYAAQ